MTEWLVRLQGEKLDLEEASFHFRAADAEVRPGDDGYCLASSEFSSMTESGEVLKRANELLNVINGILKVTFPNHQPVSADGIVVRVDEAGKRDRYVHIAGTLGVRVRMRANLTVIKPDGTAEPAAQHPTQAASWMAIARRNADVTHVLGLFAQPTLVRLYNILDVVAGDVGGEKALINMGWAAKGEIKRFKQTVDSMEAAGDDARHGKKNFKAPKKPMSLREAQNLVGAIIRGWLQIKPVDSDANEG